MRAEGRTPAIDRRFQQAVAAAEKGDRRKAQKLFTQVTRADERHVQAWLWLAGLAQDKEVQAGYVEKVRALSLGSDDEPASAAAAHPAQALPRLAIEPAGRVQEKAQARPSQVRGLRIVGGRLRVDRRGAAALGFLLSVALAEVLVTYADPRLGVAVHAALLVGLLAGSARAVDTRSRALWVSLAFAPLIRIMSLSLPLTRFPMLYWYLITSIPLFAAAMVAAPVVGYRWRELGLTLRGWPLQILVGLTGLLFGDLEYRILHPAPLAESLAWQHLWLPALILLISTGLLEEILFRGLMQRAAGDVLKKGGVVYVALLFAVLHLGYKSAVDVLFVLGVGLFFGWVVARTRSLVGVTLAHGLTNIMLFLIAPFLAGG